MTKKRPKKRPPLRVLPTPRQQRDNSATPPAVAPVSLAQFPDEEQEIRDRVAITDRHRGERNAQSAAHARELADLLVRHTQEESRLEHRHQLEIGELWRAQGRDVPWLEHQRVRGARRA